MELSNRVQNLAASATFAMMQKAAEMKDQGIDVISLSVGEPDFNTPDFVKAAAVQAIADNWSKYSPVPGYPALKRAVCLKLKAENGLDYSESQILISNGAKQSICNVLMALVNAGDEVLIPAPYWVSYPQMVLLAEGTPVFIDAPMEQDFKITPAQLEAAISPRTKALILCSPSNPTGAVYSKEELRGLKDVLLRHPEVIVISDEIYEHLNYIGSHESIAQFDDLRDRVVVVNGVSKAYAMTGWRIGYIAGPEWIVKGCNKLQGQYTSGACSVSQMAALAAYEGDQSCVEQMRQAFQRRRDLIVRLLREVPGFEVNEPQGAFYVFPKCDKLFGKRYGAAAAACGGLGAGEGLAAADCSGAEAGTVIRTASDFAMFLLEQAHVATVGGDSFGAPACIRLSYATSESQITEACRRIKLAVESLG